MIIESREFGRIEMSDIPLPEGIDADVNGTYTYSGRVLAIDIARSMKEGRAYEGVKICFCRERR